MTGCKEVTACRVCGGALREVLDLGRQCLQGVFPGPGEADPPRFPLVLARCVDGCGLVQLAHTVEPGLMFNEGYGYRSGVTQTMREHLNDLAIEAADVLGRVPERVLDIGCNDCTLLRHFPTSIRVGVDPSTDGATAVQDGEVDMILQEPYPTKNAALRSKFDLIFTVACFYDADDPVAFAAAVRDNLAEGGLWCVEVADLTATIRGAWDSIVSEHLCYYEFGTLSEVMRRAGLAPVKATYNACNGGSLRVYARKGASPDVDETFADAAHLGRMVWKVHGSARRLKDCLHQYRKDGLEVHLLGASTKANTVLQFCEVTPELIQYASDRDPRKAGRRTPGTGIPIVSEEESRAMRPDVYVCLLHGFKDEVAAREKEFLDRGGGLVFPLPTFSEVRR